MEINKLNTIAFTGHRVISTSADTLAEYLLAEIEKQYKNGYRIYLVGMAQGFDLLAGEAVLKMKEKYSDIQLICVIPFRFQANRYHFIDQMRYADILEQANKEIILSDHYYDKCFLHRNDFLIKNSSLLIAYCNGAFRSGTAYTIRRAIKNSIPIINLYNNK